MKIHDYKGQTVKNVTVTLKIDGVRVIKENGIAKSRKGNILNHCENCHAGEYEVFLGNFKDTYSRLSTIEGNPIPRENFYPLGIGNFLDKRLLFEPYDKLNSKQVAIMLKYSLGLGYEGLVLRTPGKWYKVKPTYTIDLKVTDWLPGQGQYAGKLGALVTEKCNVGTGFTDEQRGKWGNNIIGKTIEIAYKGLTSNGVPRHPYFLRLREDK